MVCPNCGTEQTEAFECVRCGVIFAKYAEVQSRLREGRPPRESSWLGPLGVPARVIRALAGAMCLVLATLMYFNGSALKAFGPYVAMVFFAGAGLYYLVSMLERMPTWRFAIEVAVTASVGAILFVSLPDVFSLGKPLYESTVFAPPASEVRAYLDAAGAQIVGVQKFLEAADVKATDDAVLLSEPLDDAPLSRAFARVPERDRDLVAPIHASMKGLRPLVDALLKQFPAELPKGPKQWVPMAVSLDLQRSLERIATMMRATSAQLDVRDAALASGPGGDAE
jgi:hypothetical protein